jgi:Zn-finger nucleic acid-binding protein
MQLKVGTDGYKCDYCQSVYVPEKDADGVQVLGEPTAEICGLCNGPLVEGVLAKIRILYCTKCHGMLVPMATFATLIDEMRGTLSSHTPQSAPDPDGLRRRINCPQCHKRMDTHFYAGPGNVIIDSCEDCGLIWLDQGEIMRIAHAPDARAAFGAYVN